MRKQSEIKTQIEAAEYCHVSVRTIREYEKLVLNFREPDGVYNMKLLNQFKYKRLTVNPIKNKKQCILLIQQIDDPAALKSLVLILEYFIKSQAKDNGRKS